MSLAEQPIAVAISWITASLRNNAAFRALINNDAKRIAPLPHVSRMVYPAIGMSLVDPKDFDVIGGAIIASDMLWAITAIDQATDISTVQPLATKMHQILHNMFDTTPDAGEGGIVLSCTRVEPIYEVDRSKDETIWQYVGGLYRIRVQ